VKNSRNRRSAFFPAFRISVGICPDGTVSKSLLEPIGSFSSEWCANRKSFMPHHATAVAIQKGAFDTPIHRRRFCIVALPGEPFCALVCGLLLGM
jgi:hypothetical protein